MTPFDKYAKTLSYFLPSRLREEVVREVMSDLYAELEAEQKVAPNEATERLMKRVLARHQSPRALARSFTERRSELIGSRVYPIYKWVLWVSLATTFLIVAPLSLFSGFHWRMLGDLSISSVIVFTIVTLIFLAIDQFGPLHHVAEAMALNQRSENVESVNENIDVEDRFTSYRRNRRILAIVLLLCLNLIPDQIGLLMLIVEPSIHVSMYPIISDAFLGIPRLLISVWCVVVLLLDLLLTIRRFARFEAKWEITLQFVGLVLGLGLLINGHIFAVPHEAVTASYSNELRTVMNTVIAPYLFQILMFILWLSWIVKTFGFFMRSKRQMLLRTP